MPLDLQRSLPSGTAHFTIYNEYVGEYDLLRSRMDRENNLVGEIRKITSPDGADIVELAAGTGKLTFLLAPFARSIRAFDLMEPMIGYARRKAVSEGISNVQFGLADNRSIPLQDACADIVLEGWSIGYLVFQTGEGWEKEIDKVLSEMWRLLRPGGVVIILGTLGTGAHFPKPPNAELAMFYDHLTTAHGFTQMPWFKTDYEFDSVDQAERLIRFFWSDRFGDYVRDKQMRIIPECTAMWIKKKEADHGE